MTTEESMQLQSFELRLGDIADVDLESLHALSIAVGWPHRAEDWQMLRAAGNGVVALDQIGRVLGSAMWFPFGSDFSTVGMVITSPRLQANGTGRWLMDHVLKQSGSRHLGLSATRAAYRLYLSMGFTPEKIVCQCQGNAVLPTPSDLPTGAVLRAVSSGDLVEIAALDQSAYGADRSAVLTQLMAVSEGTVLTRGGCIAAFALCRRFGRGFVVGPVVASNDADAIAVAEPHVAAHAGQFLRLDTRNTNGPFAEKLTQWGLPVFDTVTSMSLGGPWLVGKDEQPAAGPMIYALINQALS